VIHAPDAPLADATMVGARRPVRFAAGAHGPFAAVSITGRRIVFVGRVQVGEVQTVGGQRHSAWIGEHGLGVGHGQQEDDGVKEHHMEGHPEAVAKWVDIYIMTSWCVQYALLTCPAWWSE